jgi:hypothetical protein
LTVTQRHRLRITLKHLHYTVELVESLFDKDQLRTFVKCLKSLQDDLGYATDVRVAHNLVDQISEATNYDARAVARAGGTDCRLTPRPGFETGHSRNGLSGVRTSFPPPNSPPRVAAIKSEAMAEAERAIDRALAPRMLRLVPPRDRDDMGLVEMPEDDPGLDGLGIPNAFR